MVEYKNTRLLIDLGNVNFTKDFFDQVPKLDGILISHKHSDHCYNFAINTLAKRDNCWVFCGAETANCYELINTKIIKEGKVFKIGDIEVNVVHAEHGYLPYMKDGYVKEAFGFVLECGSNRLYFAGDSICFPNSLRANVAAMSFAGNGLTTGVYDGIMMAKAMGAKSVIPINLDNKFFKTNFDYLFDLARLEGITVEHLMVGETKEY